MKRIFSLILTILLLLSACGGKDTPATAPSETESIPTAAPETTGPEGIREEDLETVYVLTKFSSLDENGNVRWYQEYEYNDLGQQTAKREYLEDGSMSFELRYTLDDKGYPASGESNQGGIKASYKWQYDDRGNLLVDEWYEGDRLMQKIVYTYDEHNNITSLDNTMTDGFNQSMTFAYTYDAQGNILTREDRMDGELSSRTEFTYDDQNRCIREVVYDFSGAVQGTYETVWEGSTSTKHSYGPEGDLFLTEVSTYDDQGNITFRENQYAGGDVTQNEYQYATIEIKK